ncbi:MAG: glycosyltransferase family 2 protein [Eubacteriales bacterium]|nr:glycosyltransferase family 2 protein [Eubacteriales bacterium]
MEEKKLMVSVVIPNWNGEKYLRQCLKSLRQQDFRKFEIIVVDNGSEDDSVDMMKRDFPEVRILRMKKNEGFCRAVNRGIHAAKAPYILLLNNDTCAERTFVKEMFRGIRRHKNCFSCQAKMMQKEYPDLMDDAGDFYSALGWAFADGKGEPEWKHNREKRIFSSCAGAAIYRKSILDKIGLFDESHFAYLEDLDLGYRAKRYGYENWFLPKARVYHVGSGTTGSRYNKFKVRHSARNNLYVIYKNMPAWQIVWNLPFLIAGFCLKGLFFWKKGLASEYWKGFFEGIRLCRNRKKVKYQKEDFANCLNIQIELWKNIKKSVFRSGKNIKKVEKN